jgi:hypothetical protein
MKNGCRIYWPTTRAISDRLWCWRIEMSDAQYLDYMHKHTQLFDSPSTFSRIANALHDFEFPIPSTADTVILPLVNTPLHDSSLDDIDVSTTSAPLQPT